MLAFLLIVCTYLAANLLASLLRARRDGRDLLPLLPVAFATIHFAYGTGFVLGLVRFWDRWGAAGRVTEQREPASNDERQRPSHG